MKLAGKLTTAFLLVSLVPQVTLALVSYDRAKAALDEQVHARLEQVARLQRSRVEATLEQNVALLQVLTRDGALRAGLASLLRQPDAGSAAALRKLLVEARDVAPALEDLDVMSLDGEPLATTRAGGATAAVPWVLAAREQARVQVVFPPGVPPQIVVAAPLVVEERVAGVLQATIRPEILAAVLQQDLALGESAEMVLAARGPNDGIHDLVLARLVASPPGHDRLQPSREKTPAQLALEGREGFIEAAIDHDGESVVAVTQLLAAAELGLVTKFDRDEAYAPIAAQRRVAAIALLVSVVLVLLVSLWLAWTITRPLNALTRRITRSDPHPGEAQAGARRADEVKSLVGAFDHLLTNLREHAQHRDRREQELAATNLALKEEVAERERAEERFRAAVESAPNGMVLVDPQGLIQMVNRQVEAQFGWSQDELLGMPVETLLPERVRPLHVEQRRAFHQAPEMRGMGLGRDLYAVRKDGAEFPVEIGLAPVPTRHGTYVLASVLDITERKRSEQRLVATAQELARSNRELDDFAHVTSHDLKEPLRGLHGYASILLEDHGEQLGEEGRGRLESMKRMVRRMDELIESLLEFSRVGRVDLALRETDLNDVLEEVLDTLHVTIEEKQVEVSVPRPLPTIRCDRVRVAQVFQNLVTNAIKYNDSDHKWIEIGHENGVFHVRDNGIGIAAKHHQAIFRIFKRLHGRDRYGGGTGAGLTIVQRILERHGGWIRVESEPGQGSTFRFAIGEEPDGHSAAPAPQSAGRGIPHR